MQVLSIIYYVFSLRNQYIVTLLSCDDYVDRDFCLQLRVAGVSSLPLLLRSRIGTVQFIRISFNVILQYISRFFSPSCLYFFFISRPNFSTHFLSLSYEIHVMTPDLLNILRFSLLFVSFRISVTPFAFCSCSSLLSYLLTYLLTPCSTVLPKKLTVPQPVKKFRSFYGTRRFITLFTNSRHLSLSWASSIQSIPPHPTSRRSILILSSRLRLLHVSTP